MCVSDSVSHAWIDVEVMSRSAAQQYMTARGRGLFQDCLPLGLCWQRDVRRSDIAGPVVGMASLALPDACGHPNRCVASTLEKDHQAEQQSMDSLHMSRNVFLCSACVFQIAYPMLGSMSK